MEGFLGLNLDDAREPELLPADKEVELQIVAASVETSKKTGSPYLSIQWEAPDFPLSKRVRQVYMFPADDDDERTRNSRLWSLRQFAEAHGLTNGIPAPEDLIGARAWAIMGVENDPQYGDQNRVKKLVARK